jgi:hypothetical protein
MHHLAVGTSDAYFTPPHLIELVKQLLQHISLDPFSCEEANQTVDAAVYFDKAKNGLRQQWRYPTVFANPPGGFDDEHSSIQERCVDKILLEFDNKHFQEGIFLLRIALATAWFNRILVCKPLCLLFELIHFVQPGGETMKRPSPHGYCFMYLGRRPKVFAEIFGSIGHVINVVEAEAEQT